MTCRLKFAPERLLPAAAIVHLFPNNASKVAGNFEITALKRTHLSPAKTSDEIAEFEQHVLPSTRLWRTSLHTPFVVGS
ncbi:hypothetical protein WM08_29025 [Burkholderia ubonensis]|nr:hypothetical protein WJ84_13945 [Burkholderia ubonensis]KVP72273.1 hypothetical protein WJ94_25760 [Burkholderia ubonensis]KVR61842.1 hypothetical protein WK19_01325 [Burkholderia ubonensis]KVR75054.1 hypothetical protein WK20_26930 [Burkholderia ubonensis]KVU95969.1 hypothetical protein WK77_30465 [Burkholderia ubonensis]